MSPEKESRDEPTTVLIVIVIVIVIVLVLVILIDLAIRYRPPATSSCPERSVGVRQGGEGTPSGAYSFYAFYSLTPRSNTVKESQLDERQVFISPSPFAGKGSRTELIPFSSHPNLGPRRGPQAILFGTRFAQIFNDNLTCAFDVLRACCRGPSHREPPRATPNSDRQKLGGTFRVPFVSAAGTIRCPPGTTPAACRSPGRIVPVCWAGGRGPCRSPAG